MLKNIKSLIGFAIFVVILLFLVTIVIKHDIRLENSCRDKLYPDSINVVTIEGDTATIYKNRYVLIKVNKYEKEFNNQMK